MWDFQRSRDRDEEKKLRRHRSKPQDELTQLESNVPLKNVLNYKSQLASQRKLLNKTSNEKESLTKCISFCGERREVYENENLSKTKRCISNSMFIMGDVDPTVYTKKKRPSLLHNNKWTVTSEAFTVLFLAYWRSQQSRARQ
ncbi:hypothetical protein TNIN_494831 [Trichonephila inaurata madagascariensis]|uniref:Uncharacterized protein n=1 Tax=Trichonephila inaurata madagascariensis TaxID=2747483 RepID=A0A8X6I449_9ARAC|nr:hypothetical protein TNIN_494831 [Trichonephila inaurata madagascariensis]